MVGGITLVVSVFVFNAVGALAGLAMIFWGIVLLLVTTTPYVKAEAIGPSFEGQRQAIRQFIGVTGRNLKATYLPPRSFEEASADSVLLTGEGESEAPVGANRPSSKLLTGIRMPPSGVGLVKYYQSKTESNFLGVDLQYIKMTLPKLLTEDLELAQSVEVNFDGDVVGVATIGAKFYRICESMSDSADSENSLACPFHSSFAIVLARATGKPITIESIDRMNDGRTIRATYKIREA
jgi:hypothetical protein